VAARRTATHCSVIFCEATAIYGVIVAIILQTKIDEVPRNADGTFLSAAVFSGYAVFASGITVGLANLACGCGRSACGLCAAASASAPALTRAALLSQPVRGHHRQQLRAERRAEQHAVCQDSGH
jgi:F0F1-type ATP synthase membrane subunit c/vacuolar-type H+-ATPase subunit K